MGDVGDMHTDLDVSVGQFPHREGIVEVLGVLRVNREGWDFAEITPRGYVLSSNLSGNLFFRSLDLGIKSVGQPELGQDGMHLRIILTRVAEHLYYLAHRVSRALVPLHYTRHGLLSLLCPVEFCEGNKEVERHVLVVGYKECEL